MYTSITVLPSYGTFQNARPLSVDGPLTNKTASFISYADENIDLNEDMHIVMYFLKRHTLENERQCYSDVNASFKEVLRVLPEIFLPSEGSSDSFDDLIKDPRDYLKKLEKALQAMPIRNEAPQLVAQANEEIKARINAVHNLLFVPIMLGMSVTFFSILAIARPSDFSGAIMYAASANLVIGLALLYPFLHALRKHSDMAQARVANNNLHKNLTLINDIYVEINSMINRVEQTPQMSLRTMEVSITKLRKIQFESENKNNMAVGSYLEMDMV